MNITRKNKQNHRSVSFMSISSESLKKILANRIQQFINIYVCIHIYILYIYIYIFIHIHTYTHIHIHYDQVKFIQDMQEWFHI